MKKETVMEYLEKALPKKLDGFEYELFWDKKNFTIEIILRLFEENELEDAVEDVDGITSELDIIEFEDAILLYDPIKSRYNAEDYLAVLPFEGKKGIEEALLKSCLQYANTVLRKGSSDLYAFLSNEDIEEFSLSWHAQDFEKIVANNRKEVKESRYLPYPRY